jgi:hypothetical protein
MSKIVWTKPLLATVNSSHMKIYIFTGLGKITSLLSATFRPIFIAINWKNSGNSFVTLYVQQDLH